MTTRIGVVLLGLAIGCGGPGKPSDPAQPDETGGAGDTAGEPGDTDGPVNPADDPASLGGEELVGAACAQMGEVHAATPCDFLTRARFTQQSCQSEMAFAKVPENLQPAFETAMRCVVASNECSGFPACFAKLQEAASTAASGGGRQCGEEGMGAVSLSAAEAGKRYGQGVSKLSAAPTTKEKPIEVCGVAAQHTWLLAAECDDGSKPLTSRGAASGARAGSVGSGGRCGSVIDRYTVTCPEKTYEVFMDLYMCGPGESI